MSGTRKTPKRERASVFERGQRHHWELKKKGEIKRGEKVLALTRRAVARKESLGKVEFRKGT